MHDKIKRGTLAAVATMFAMSGTVMAAGTLTRDSGTPVGDNQNSQTAGPDGGTLLQDVQLVEKLQRFGRERIPERVVHARGTGARGEFVSSVDGSDLTIAAPFATPGKVTPVFVRFSTVAHPSGSPETLRDPRGFAVKFYTDQGNWDLVGNDLPVFFIRDAIKFPDFIHSVKPSPISNRQDANRYFDFFAHTPESTHMVTQLYSNLGIPASYRTMDGFGVHAFKFVNAKGDVRYVKLHWKSQQGIHSLNGAEASKIQAVDFNNLTHDLYDQINAGNLPKWDLMVQVLKPEDLTKFDFNALDDTKIWPNVPESKLGTMTLTKVPDNFFQETEQSAFAPSRMVPGVEPSEDRMLQGRLFSYADTQTYRLGINNQQIPVNRPLVPVANNNQDGAGNQGHTTSDINYYASGDASVPREDPKFKPVQTKLSGYTQQVAIKPVANFKQAGDFYRALPQSEKDDLIDNMVGDLVQVKSLGVKDLFLSHIYKADVDYGTRVAQRVGGDLTEVQRLAKAL